jgi:hypothetical protein
LYRVVLSREEETKSFSLADERTKGGGKLQAAYKRRMLSVFMSVLSQACCPLAVSGSPRLVSAEVQKAQTGVSKVYLSRNQSSISACRAA